MDKVEARMRRLGLWAARAWRRSSMLSRYAPHRRRPAVEPSRKRDVVRAADAG